MSADTAKFDAALEYVVAAKAAYRTHAQSLTWEEKVASIERMWVRDAELKRVRELNAAQRNAALKQKAES